MSGNGADGKGDRSITLDVAILGREFKVACKESERAELVEAVAYLDRRMREIRDAGKVSGTDRIAVMAALNIAHELMQSKQRADIDGGTLAQQLQTLRGKLDTALATHVK